MIKSRPKKAQQPQESPQQPEAPAVVQHDHVQDRVLSAGAGSKAGWSRLPVYEREHRLGHLLCKERCTNDHTAKVEIERALDRHEAAREFDKGWIICNASWPSGSDLNRVRVAGCPGGFVDHQRDTKAFWRAVEAAMSTNDWMIVRRVCGENHTVAKTVHDISPSYKLSTLARFREAIDALIIAMKAVQKTISHGTSDGRR